MRKGLPIVPELEGYKTLDLVMRELCIGKPKVRAVLKALDIQPTRFNFDKRIKYYSQEDVRRMHEWLHQHQTN